MKKFICCVFFAIAPLHLLATAPEVLRDLEQQINQHVALIKKIDTLHLNSLCSWSLSTNNPSITDPLFVAYVNQIAEQGCLGPLYDLWMQHKGYTRARDEYVQFVRQFLIVLFMVYRDYLSQVLHIDKEVIDSALDMLKDENFLNSADTLMTALHDVYTELEQIVSQASATLDEPAAEAKPITLKNRIMRLWPLWVAIGVIAAFKIRAYFQNK